MPVEGRCFSALQRAEIAEIALPNQDRRPRPNSFSALQRAEIAEIVWCRFRRITQQSFSALQRAEIAEMQPLPAVLRQLPRVSVLFNEPKLLKCKATAIQQERRIVSVLFNEPKLLK